MCKLLFPLFSVKDIKNVLKEFELWKIDKHFQVGMIAERLVKIKSHIKKIIIIFIISGEFYL